MINKKFLISGIKRILPSNFREGNKQTNRNFYKNTNFINKNFSDLSTSHTNNDTKKELAENIR